MGNVGGFEAQERERGEGCEREGGRERKRERVSLKGKGPRMRVNKKFIPRGSTGSSKFKNTPLKPCVHHRKSSSEVKKTHRD